MISAKDRFIQLKFLHRAYYTLVRLSKICPETKPSLLQVSFLPRYVPPHGMGMPLIHQFWEKVVWDLNEFGDWTLSQGPALALLCTMEDIVASRNVKLFLFYALYYTKRDSP